MTDVTERMNYYDGEFLKAVDFTAEQSYHIDRQRRHNRLLHTTGVAGSDTDLDVSLASGVVTVTSGTAVDDQGCQIVLPNGAKLNLGSLSGQNLLVVISYDEKPTQDATPGDDTTATRCQELAIVQVIPATADVDTKYPPGTYLRLASIAADGTTNDLRQFAGSKNIARGWLRLPFLPKPFTTVDGNGKTTLQPTFTLLGSYATSATGTGASGVMEIPIPPGATSIQGFSIGIASSDDDIDVTLYMNSWDGTQFSDSPLVETTITKNSQAVVWQPSSQPDNLLDPQTVGLALLVQAKGQSDIRIIAVEFA